MQRNPYRFTKKKGKKSIEVMFAHIPGKWFSARTSDMSQAVLWAERKLQEDGLPSNVEKDPPTLRQFAKDFFKDSDPQGIRRRDKVRGYSFGTTYYEQKQKLLENHILPYHGDYRLTSIGRNMIEDLVYNLTNVNGTRLLATSTRNKVFECYSIVLKEAERQGLIAKNPCADAEKLSASYSKREAFTSTELRQLFPDDVDTLVWIWTSLQWACYFLIQYETGWRPGEVAALESKNFFPESNGIYTTSDIDWKHRKVQPRIKTSDSGQPFKVGVLSERTSKLLSQLKAQTKGRYFFVLGRSGKFIGSDGANDRIEEACRRAGIPLERNGKKRTQYSFRHSFQSYYLGRIPESARLLLMGHTKTRNEYTHLDAQEVLERVREVEGLDEAIEKRRG